MFARGVRNVIYNYTDAQRKVRSATSNDAWGPSPALMHEIADLTNNMVAYSEMMPIIWKRLNDHGKNWRHVYKSLVLLDHLIKYGNERVIQHCRENIFSIQTLKDFQHVEDHKDQGYNVREKSKQLVTLLKDDERLRNERRKAQEARRQYVRQTIGMDSNGSVTYGHMTTSTMRRNSFEGNEPSYLPNHDTNSYSTTAFRSTSYNDRLHATEHGDFIQPNSQEEEQLQMQIALAESQREAENEERRRRNDEMKLKMAIERSVHESSTNSQLFDLNTNSQQLDSSMFSTHENHSSFLQLPTRTSNSPWNPTNNRPSTHLGFTSVTNDPWSSELIDPISATSESNDSWQHSTLSGWQQPQINPWNENDRSTVTTNNPGLSVNLSDPWGIGATSSPSPLINSPPATTNSIDNELSDFFGTSATTSSPSNPWNATSSPTTNISTSRNNETFLYPTISSEINSNPMNTTPSYNNISRKTPESFLGEKFSTLVNLNELVPDYKNINPFSSNTTSRTPNPFIGTAKAPTLDQLTTSNNNNNNNMFASGSTLPAPLIPSSYNNTTTTVPSFNTNNPFM